MDPEERNPDQEPDMEHAGGASGMIGAPGGGNFGETGPKWAAFGGTPGHPGVSRGGGGGPSGHHHPESDEELGQGPGRA